MSKTTIPTGGITADAVNATLIADDAINSEHYTDGSIDTAHVADSQITAVKTSGVGGLVKLGEVAVTSATATMTVDNCFTSSYDLYKIVGYASPATAGANLYFRWRTGGGSGSSYTTSDYSWITEGQYIQDGSTAQYLNWNFADNHARLGSDVGDGTDKAVNFQILTTDPNTQQLAHPFFTGTASWKLNTSARFASAHIGNNNAAAIDATGFSCLFSSGNIAKGQVIVYGFQQS